MDKSELPVVDLNKMMDQLKLPNIDLQAIMEGRRKDLEAIVKRAVVVERDGEATIAIRPMACLCMSWDHRALDGAEAARFLGEIKAGLEQGAA